MSRNVMLPSNTEQIQQQFFTAFPQIDANALNDIEIEAQYLAANLDGITENLANLLHSVNTHEINESKPNKIQICDFILLDLLIIEFIS